MLVLSRREGEGVRVSLSAEMLRRLAALGSDVEIEVKVVENRADKCRLGFTAPKEVPIHRNEIWEKIRGNSDGKAA